MLEKNKDAVCQEAHELMRVVREHSGTDEAKAAFGKIYQKYWKTLWALCVKVCGQGAGADLVFEETWKRIWKHPDYDYDTHRTRFETWMSRIASRAACDIRIELTLGDEELSKMNLSVSPVEYEVEGVQDAEPNLNLRLVEEAMAQLSEKESDILRTYIMYDTDSKRHVPDKILEELKTKYQTSNVNLRKIKSRALEKVRDYVNSRR